MLLCNDKEVFGLCFFRTQSGLYLLLKGKSVSFTLRVGSGSCGSGLVGTESEMSWSDPFSSFYQRTQRRTKA